VRHPRLSFAVGVLAITTGCSTSDQSVGPEPPHQIRREVFSEDCTLGAEECQQIQRGIDYLRNHANPECRLAGQNAQERFDATSGEGFRSESQPSNHPEWDMGVNPNPYPSDGYTLVYPRFAAQGYTDYATGGLIAHEEVHHLGGNDNSAYSLQNACLNPQP
jgi:hypothetical protein